MNKNKIYPFISPRIFIVVNWLRQMLYLVTFDLKYYVPVNQIPSQTSHFRTHKRINISKYNSNMFNRQLKASIRKFFWIVWIPINFSETINMDVVVLLQFTIQHPVIQFHHQRDFFRPKLSPTGSHSFWQYSVSIHLQSPAIYMAGL